MVSIDKLGSSKKSINPDDIDKLSSEDDDEKSEAVAILNDIL